MEYCSISKFNWLLRIKAHSSDLAIKIHIRLLGFIKFSTTLLKHKKLSRKKIARLAQQYSQATIIFTHRLGGGSNFYLDECIDESKKQNNIIFMIYPAGGGQK